MNLFQQGDFLISPDTTPEMLKAKRDRLAALMPQYGKAEYIGEGLGQLFNGIGTGRQNKAMDGYEGDRSAEAAQQFAAATGGPMSILGMRQQEQPTAFNPDPTAPTTIGNDTMAALGKPSNNGGLQQGIIETAQALGIDPADLATAISYETAGTFDPTKAGPTTQWGQHRGLIQFGEPQAAKYGVDWNDPIGSQLGANGAVAKYLQDTGVKPGMGMMDIYSAINAGGVGRYGASDANNGGAPGTVADKVNSQMAGHRQKAMALLGGEYTPANAGAPTQGQPMQGGQDMDALLQAQANPWLTQSQRAVLDGMISQRQSQQAAAEERYWRQNDPAYQQGLIKGQLEIDAMRNPAPEKGTSDMQEYQYAQSQGYKGTFQDYMMDMKKAGATSVNVGGDSAPGLGKLSTDYGYVLDPATGMPKIDTTTGLPTSAPIPGSPAAIDAEKAKLAASVKSGNAGTATDIVTTAASRAREAAGMRELGGFGSSLMAAINPYSDSAEVGRQVDVLRANASTENMNAMRAASPTGAALGAASDRDIQLLADKSGALDPSSPTFVRDLDDYELTLLRIIHGKEAGDLIYEQTRAPQTGATGDTNVPDAEGWIVKNGVKMRVKQ